MKTTIIGLGLIGGSLAKDLRKSKFATELIGVDANKNHAKQALELGLVDQINTLEEAVKNTDLIIIAIPVDKELEVLPVVLDKMNGNATVS
ncbi:MAG: prephenate dehydrogenase/arogenate dehydrogenase family protein, partial [Prolixibacteraceae bacterium]|nr:prephenate dehydrogenase/arogenate dehydrogenase family protein [Prolixibacteraceae bacterium]